MARYTTIRELQAKASKLIDSARNGEPLIVTSHGKPVAVLSPVSPDEADQVAFFLERMRSYSAFRKLQAVAATRPQLSEDDIEAVIADTRRSQ